MFQFRRTSASETETADRGQYKALEDQAEDSLFRCDNRSLQELTYLKKKLLFFQVGFYTALVIQAWVFVYWSLLSHAESQPHATYRDLEWSGLLGEDWNGLVPNGIGQPLRPTYFGPDHPYYMPEDIFNDFDRSMAMIDKWKSMHNGSSVLVEKNAPHVKRIKPNGDVAEMEPFWPWEPRDDGKEIYAIRGFHQMHCIFVISEEFAYHYNKANETKWTAGHVAHCINTIRDAIMCMADAQPLSFANGYKVGHATDDQAMMCRDWTALHVWVSDPSRGVRVKNVAPPGSLTDKIVPIIPYPELSDLELKGLA
ncbi:hypothetical protein CSPAE12_06655 [Colletotrichum incanum]|nr:hypothetical protein CSPAE12_06655 [Colletotrichum incanum]